MNTGASHPLFLPGMYEQVERTGLMPSSARAGAPEVRILAGDSYQLLPQVPDESIDIIFTDPPYIASSLRCYGLLAREAVRILRPGGYLWAYCGAFYLPRAFAEMAVPGLDWFWQFREHHSSGFVRVQCKRVLQAGKPLLVFTKGKPGRLAWLIDEFRSGRRAKRNHRWQQDIAVPLEVFRRLCRHGETALDPFAGSGTVLCAARVAGMNGIGIEIEPAVAEMARARVAEVRPCPLLRAQYGEPLTIKGL